jgi:hypothetical protein
MKQAAFVGVRSEPRAIGELFNGVAFRASLRLIPDGIAVELSQLLL